MAEQRFILGQINVSTTVVTGYTVPVGKEAVLSSLTFCNITSSAVTLCAAVVSATDSQGTENWLYYNMSMPANDTFVATIGITLSAGDQIRAISSGTSSIALQIFGVEVS